MGQEPRAKGEEPDKRAALVNVGRFMIYGAVLAAVYLGWTTAKVSGARSAGQLAANNTLGWSAVGGLMLLGAVVSVLAARMPPWSSSDDDGDADE